MTYELPLFPLNTVLFPGMPLRLHIFEERYKLMIDRCRQQDAPFGVTLIKRGQEVGGRAEPYAVGCTAIISEIEPLPDGRLNIVAIGQERFQIQSLRYDQPYLVGMVENYPLSAESSDLQAAAGMLRGWVRRYLELLAQASKSEFDLDHLPGDPLKLAYLASFLIQVPMMQKQSLLAAGATGALLASLRAIYRREVTLLAAMLVRHDDDDSRFSLN